MNKNPASLAPKTNQNYFITKERVEKKTKWIGGAIGALDPRSAALGHTWRLRRNTYAFGVSKNQTSNPRATED